MIKIGFICFLLGFLQIGFAEISVGDTAPNFKLVGHDGKQHSLEEYKGKVVVLEWFNHGCPFVRKHYDSNNMQKLQKKWVEKEVVWLSIVSSGKGRQGYLASTTEAMQRVTTSKAQPSVLLLDPEGKVGKLYGAKTTPHMYILDKVLKVAYVGAIDSIKSTNPRDIAKATNYVEDALQSIVIGEVPKVRKTRPYGCSVKYSN